MIKYRKEIPCSRSNIKNFGPVLIFIKKIIPGSVFINTGRSNVVSESDLLEALDNGSIREAILDVFDKEPLPTGHPFW